MPPFHSRPKRRPPRPFPEPPCSGFVPAAPSIGDPYNDHLLLLLPAILQALFRISPTRLSLRRRRSLSLHHLRQATVAPPVCTYVAPLPALLLPTSATAYAYAATPTFSTAPPTPSRPRPHPLRHPLPLRRPRSRSRSRITRTPGYKG
ncbi:MAG: hypothetical protein K9M97_05780 [Akkermansiaceae bacterium]|nr:hypothetical protein [Akkermansiaceae bacterium]